MSKYRMHVTTRVRGGWVEHTGTPYVVGDIPASQRRARPAQSTTTVHMATEDALRVNAWARILEMDPLEIVRQALDEYLPAERPR